MLAQLVTVGHPGTLARVSGSSASDTGAAASSNGLSQASLDGGEGAGIGDEWKHLQDVGERRGSTPPDSWQGSSKCNLWRKPLATFRRPNSRAD